MIGKVLRWVSKTSLIGGSLDLFLDMVHHLLGLALSHAELVGCGHSTGLSLVQRDSSWLIAHDLYKFRPLVIY